ncbi:MAG: hypothetical protein KDJ52_22390 [Anaerolineae bacterium]|nr:hypothetical protein [Anaerolineae bacterium]
MPFTHRTNTLTLKRFCLKIIIASFILLGVSTLSAFAQQPGTITVIDSNPYALHGMLVTDQNLPIIAYDGSKVAFCKNVTCTNKKKMDFYNPNSIYGVLIEAMVLKGGNLPVILYSDYPNSGIIICHDPLCNNFSNTRLDLHDKGYEIYKADVTLTPGGWPVIVFYEIDHHKLFLARCNDALCKTPLTYRAVASPTTHTFDVEVVLSKTGNPITLFQESSGQDFVQLVTCEDPNCTTRVQTKIQQVDVMPYQVEMQLNSQGLPVLSYIVAYDQSTTPDTRDALRVVICENIYCTQKTGVYINAGKDKGLELSMALGPGDRPMISYDTGYTKQDIMLMACLDAPCSQTTTTLIDDYDETDDNVLGLDNNGLPIVAYQENLNNEVKLYTSNVAQGNVMLDYNTARPGSILTLTGTKLPTNSSAIVSINGVGLGQALTTNNQGTGVVHLDTSQADPGFYTLKIQMDNGFGGQLVRQTTLHIDPKAPLHISTNTGSLITIPAGIARPPQFVYVPYISRN